MHSKVDIQVVFTNGISHKQPVDHAAVNFDKAITLTGFGKFHYLLVLVCGLTFSSVGFQNGLNAYVMPSAQCDLELTSNEKGLLNALFIGGGIASAFFWGILADHVGRKKVLVASLIIDGIITLAASLSQTFATFAIFRFLNGFIIGAPGSIVIPYLGEFLSDKQRAPSLCAMGFFWTISWMILPAVAYVIIPISWEYRTVGFLYNSWRIFVALFSLPTLVSGVLLALIFPESPKFLFTKGQESEALNILRHMHRVNYGKDTAEYPVKAITPDDKEGASPPKILKSVDNHSQFIKRSSGKSLSFILRGVWDQVASLFSPSVIGATTLASTLMFTNMFAYFGLGLWLPELFNRFEEHYKTSNLSVTVCEVTARMSNMSAQSLSQSSDSNVTDYSISMLEDSCTNNAINPTVFVNTFIIGASCLVGTFLSSVLAKRMGLKKLIIITMLVSAVSATSIYFLRTATENLLMSCVFLTFVGTANMVIGSAVVDLFPTKVRALAVCTAIFSGRMGAVASNLTLGYILDISCEVPIFLMGLVLLGGCAVSFLLPKEEIYIETDHESKQKNPS